MTPKAALLSSIVVGRHGETQLREGWHEREHDGRTGIPFCAAKREGTLELAPEPGAGVLCVVLTAHLGLAPGGRVSGCIALEGGPALPLELDVETWVLRRMDVPEGLREHALEEARPLRLSLSMHEELVPDRVLKNGDARRLGWLVTAVWQQRGTVGGNS